MLKDAKKRKERIMWEESYFNKNRFRVSNADKERQNSEGLKKDDPRLACESDFGRVVFSSSCRRLHDKTQVFPLTNDDNLHSRLTHSMEVMNVGLSFALRLSKNEEFLKHIGMEKKGELAYRYLSAILKTAGLVHDIGNPPFGHFGEESIKSYFLNLFDELRDELTHTDIKDLKMSKNPILNHIIRDAKGGSLSEEDKRNNIQKLKDFLESDKILDYTQFDGNAQGFRVLTKLQFLDDLCGLNLTYATLAATIKYPNAQGMEETPVHKHKHGIFTTEELYLKKIAEVCKMKKGDDYIRHPLSYLMEAADSICYMVMDVEDGCSKRSWLDFNVIQQTFNDISEETKKLLPFLKPQESTLSGQRYKKAIVEMRTSLLAYFIDKTIGVYLSNIDKIEEGSYTGTDKDNEGELVYDDNEKIGQRMMKLTKDYILAQREIHSLEITGDAIIKGIMDCLINLLFNNNKQYRNRGKNFISRSIFLTTLQEYLVDIEVAKQPDIVSREEKYMEEIAKPSVKAEDIFEGFDVYKFSVEERLRIIRDFVACMTDKFALNFYQKLSGQKVS